MNKMKSAKSFKKAPPIAAPRDADTDIQFELELCWCIHQLENALNSGKLTQKVADDTAKNIKTLKSSAALIKKRQVMKFALGDYRAKMKEEEKKMSLASKQIKFNATVSPKGSFVKKAAILNSGKDFRFNFKPPEAAITTSEAVEENYNTTTTSEAISNRLELTSGGAFKFNFNIDEMNENLKFSELAIKS